MQRPQQWQQQQQWQGPLGSSSLQQLPPDAGPASAAAASGIITIGAAPWVVNYNVPVKGNSLQAAKAVAREVSERGGGLPGVEVRALADTAS
jgi:glutamate formiminotransferase